MEKWVVLKYVSDELLLTYGLKNRQKNKMALDSFIKLLTSLEIVSFIQISARHSFPSVGFFSTYGIHITFSKIGEQEYYLHEFKKRLYWTQLLPILEMYWEERYPEKIIKKSQFWRRMQLLLILIILVGFLGPSIYFLIGFSNENNAQTYFLYLSLIFALITPVLIPLIYFFIDHLSKNCLMSAINTI